MIKKPISCKLCPLYQTGEGFVKPEGNDILGVTLIGDYPSAGDIREGVPFKPFSQSGSKLAEVFKIIGVKREQFRLGNVISCNPIDNKLEWMPYESKAVECCEVNRKRVYASNIGGDSLHHHLLDDIQHKVTVALGNVAHKTLTGYNGMKKEAVNSMRGFIYDTKYGYIIPSIDPKVVKRGKPQYIQYLIHDIKKAISLAKTIRQGVSYDIQEKREYIEYGTRDQLRSFYYKVKDNQNRLLTYDIETEDSLDVEEDERDALSNSVITQIQFSLGMRQGITVSFTSEVIPIIKALFLLDNPKANHNCWHFDNPRLAAKGIKINGTIFDTMWMFKHWQPGLLRGLQPVASLFGFPFAWKHLFNSQQEFYGCADVDSVQYVMNSLPEVMKKDKVWGNYERYHRPIYDVTGYTGHVQNFWPIMEDASKRGIHINRDVYNDVKTYFDDERIRINNELQTLVPDEVKKLAPTKKVKSEDGQITVFVGYRNPPKKVITAEYQQYLSLPDRQGFGRYLSQRRIEKRNKNGKVTERFTYVCLPNENGLTSKWYKRLEFKPSKDQLITYLDWKRNTYGTKDRASRQLRLAYRIPLTIKTNKPTTGRKALTEILDKTHDDVILRIIGDEKRGIAGLRSIDTNINNYLPNWKPDNDDSVHTLYGFTAASGQLDSRAPNVLNASKHTTLGQIFRKIIQAPDGYTFVEADVNSFHICTAGYCAEDETYIRFGKIDPHSFFTAYIVKDNDLPIPKFTMSDEDIREICAKYKSKYKKVRQGVAKPAVLGNQLGLGAMKLYLQNKEYFASIKDAAEKQAILNNLFPKVARFKLSIREKAHRQGYLTNEWGYIQRFFEVFRWEWDVRARRFIRKSGSESEKCIAFPIQSVAFGMIRYWLLQLESDGYLEKFNFVTSIHDSLVMMPRDEDIEECKSVMTKVMTAPCPMLINNATKDTGGLAVNIGFSSGKNWANYNEQTNQIGMKEE